MAALLVGGPALAQTVDDGADRMSAADAQHIEALFQAQQPDSDGLDGETAPVTLTREDIAAYRSEGGWGKAFKEMQADGYFKEYKNLGEVISAYRSRTGRTESDVARDRVRRGDSLRPDKPNRVEKVDRVQRMTRIERPSRPHRR